MIKTFNACEDVQEKMMAGYDRSKGEGLKFRNEWNIMDKTIYNLYGYSPDNFDYFSHL